MRSNQNSPWDRPADWDGASESNPDGDVLVGNVLVEEDVLLARFACDLETCLGGCCELGRFGVRLLAGEDSALESDLPTFRRSATPETQARIEEGTQLDELDGDLYLGAFPDHRCVFSSVDDEGVLGCQLERSHRAGLTEFIKPLTCHLFPLSVEDKGESQVLSLIRHPTCDAAYLSGTGLLEFSREPLIRAFGHDWYTELLEALPAARQETRARRRLNL